jgi:aldose sugar dehydrogenase
MVDCYVYSSSRGWDIPTRSFVAVVIIILSSIVIIPYSYTIYTDNFASYAAYTRALPTTGGPAVNDPNLKVEVVAEGLHMPTSFAFLGPNDILVLEKNSGDVLRVLNGEILKTPLLHVNVATPFLEWGLLGIAVAKGSNANEPRNVFLYYTESGGKVGVAAANGLYRYELTNDNTQLINPKLLLDLPANTPNPPPAENNHNGGKVLIGPDNNVYIVIGDVGGHQGQAQNVEKGSALDGTSGIFRITQDGQPMTDNPLVGSTGDHSSSSKHGKGGEEGPTSTLLNYYYAYGIRNSFGMDFDPITGKLWDTENGPAYGDEINLVEPGFNSGWSKIQGVWLVHGPSPGPIAPLNPSNLVDFGGKGVYRAPEFTWLPTIGPTALKFLDSAKLGSQYQNDMFVGDVNTGNLYHFKLNQNRDGLALSGPLASKVDNNLNDLKSVIFGQGFGTITDLQVGPDGYLYVLTFAGNIYRIVPSHSIGNNGNNGNGLESTSTSSTVKNNNNIPSSSNNQLLTPNQQLSNTSNNESNNNAGLVMGRIIPEHTPSRIIK